MLVRNKQDRYVDRVGVGYDHLTAVRGGVQPSNDLRTQARTVTLHLAVVATPINGGSTSIFSLHTGKAAHSLSTSCGRWRVREAKERACSVTIRRTSGVNPRSRVRRCVMVSITRVQGMPPLRERIVVDRNGNALMPAHAPYSRTHHIDPLARSLAHSFTQPVRTCAVCADVSTPTARPAATAPSERRRLLQAMGNARAIVSLTLTTHVSLFSLTNVQSKSQTTRVRARHHARQGLAGTALSRAWRERE